jgi:hypothetical protein
MPKFHTCLSIILLAGLTLSQAAYSQTEIGINQVRNRSTYMLDLLKLALSYSGKQHEFVQAQERLSKNAEREAALSGKIAVFWGGTSEDQERDFIPIRIDGYRGLMSLRFFIIRGDDQARFNQVRSLDDLKSIRFGQGRNWKDSQILESHGFYVAKSAKKQNLFYMLEGGRFDAFPRGATEAWKEAQANRELGLSVEKSLILRYPLPTYFFVNKDRKTLARDIHEGLTKALEDGSFDDFFYSNDRVQAFLKSADLENRTVIEITNPLLPRESAKSLKESHMLSLEQLIEGSKNFN